MGVKQNVPYLKTVILPNPAVATDLAIVAPGNGLWRVISVVFRLVTDANAANRFVQLTADDGSNVWWQAAAPEVQAASTTIDHGAYVGATTSTLVVGVAAIALPADGLWLEPGWALRSVTDNVQAGDQFSAVTALVEEFPSGPRTTWSPTTARAEYDRS
jgi:hypothetical protein